MFGHQVGDDDTGRPGEPHVAVNNHQTSSSHCSVDIVRRPVEISVVAKLSHLHLLTLALIKLTLKYYSEVDHQLK